MRLIIRALLLAALLSALAPGVASACDLVVSASGEDDAAGTSAAPLRTPEALADQLGRGQTGCIRGTVEGDAWIDAPHVTLTSEPGSRGTIVGEVVIESEATHATVSDLTIDGSRSMPTPTIYGSHSTFTRNDISNGKRGICFQIGPGGPLQRAPVRDVTLSDNRIHDCGRSNNHRHGIYISNASGTRIVGNSIFDNGDRGIQLYPWARDTLIAGNVLDGNGENVSIGGARGHATTGTRVRHNVMTNPRERMSVESYWEEGSPVGRDNRVEQNCITGGISDGAGGFTARFNVFEDPQYANRAAKDFRLAAGSRCARLLAEGRRDAGLSPAATAARAPAKAKTKLRAARRR